MRILAAIVIAALAAGAAAAQDERCAPGFEFVEHPDGNGLGYTCRTRVLRCPERADHHVSIVPDSTLEVYTGAQFAYRCRYTPLDPRRR
jgi:hypothetical protein